MFLLMILGQPQKLSLCLASPLSPTFQKSARDLVTTKGYSIWLILYYYLHRNKFTFKYNTMSLIHLYKGYQEL